jgi:hypothetical protein
MLEKGTDKEREFGAVHDVEMNWNVNLGVPKVFLTTYTSLSN